MITVNESKEFNEFVLANVSVTACIYYMRNGVVFTEEDYAIAKNFGFTPVIIDQLDNERIWKVIVENQQGVEYSIEFDDARMWMIIQNYKKQLNLPPINGNHTDTHKIKKLRTELIFLIMHYEIKASHEERPYVTHLINKIQNILKMTDYKKFIDMAKNELDKLTFC